MKKFFLFCLCLFIVGCATNPVDQKKEKPSKSVMIGGQEYFLMEAKQIALTQESVLQELYSFLGLAFDKAKIDKEFNLIFPRGGLVFLTRSKLYPSVIGNKKKECFEIEIISGHFGNEGSIYFHKHAARKRMCVDIAGG